LGRLDEVVVTATPAEAVTLVGPTAVGGAGVAVEVEVVGVDEEGAELGTAKVEGEGPSVEELGVTLI